MRRLLPFASLLLAASLTQAAPEQVLVVGLFPNAAVLNVDGQRKLVKVGQVGPGGVEVVSADSRGAVLRIDGQTRRFELGREYSEGFSAPSKQQISIARGLGGHYWVAGSVDGHPMQFLVDTGATSLAINEQHAKRLGLDYRVKGRPMLASTASGTAKGWKLSVDRVKVGSLEVLGVDTVVLEGDAPTEALLGMSFLSRVRWREEQGVLVLESKL
jgi:aspartyl protease family protein